MDFTLKEIRKERFEGFDSKFIKPFRVHYMQNGKERFWDAIEVHDSVATLLYKVDSRELVFVKQVRPPIMEKVKEPLTYELCAGIVDKPLPLTQIAAEEIEEECGYRVAPDSLEKITSFFTSVGFAGARQTLFFARINEQMRISGGGGVEAEQIEVIYLPLARARAFMYDESRPKTPGFLFAFMWFFDNYKDEI